MPDSEVKVPEDLRESLEMCRNARLAYSFDNSVVQEFIERIARVEQENKNLHAHITTQHEAVEAWEEYWRTECPDCGPEDYKWMLNDALGNSRALTSKVARIARVEQEHDQLRAILRDMCAIAGTDEWDKAMTGRQIILRKALSLAWPNGRQVRAGNGSSENE